MYLYIIAVASSLLLLLPTWGWTELSHTSYVQEAVCFALFSIFSIIVPMYPHCTHIGTMMGTLGTILIPTGLILPHSLGLLSGLYLLQVALIYPVFNSFHYVPLIMLLKKMEFRCLFKVHYHLWMISKRRIDKLLCNVSKNHTVEYLIILVVICSGIWGENKALTLSWRTRTWVTICHHLTKLQLLPFISPGSLKHNNINLFLSHVSTSYTQSMLNTIVYLKHKHYSLKKKKF